MRGRMLRHMLGAAMAGVLMTMVSGPANASEADLQSGLAHLRAGAQAQAERDLLKYRDSLRDSEARRSIDRVLPLLRRPLTEDVREYVAGTIEASVRPTAEAQNTPARRGVLSRMFPVFP